MDGLIIDENPRWKLPTMVVAFAGWPDAAESATGAVKFLVDKLRAREFAHIDPEEFYDFTQVRPLVTLTDSDEREIRWPSNTFYSYAPEDESQGLLFFVGTEPNLHWRSYTAMLLSVAEQCGVTLVVSLGALLDAVPHTRVPPISGRASPAELARKVQWLGVPSSGYTGPTGIHTVFMDACVKNGLAHASIWGHTPRYLTMGTNPKVSYALLSKLRGLVAADLDIEDLRDAADAFQKRVTQAISTQADMKSYVRRLEQKYDSAQPAPTEIPSPDVMVEELEEFLKTQRPGFEERDDE